jgi:hypothetical protein
MVTALLAAVENPTQGIKVCLLAGEPFGDRMKTLAGSGV